MYPVLLPRAGSSEARGASAFGTGFHLRRHEDEIGCRREPLQLGHQYNQFQPGKQLLDLALQTHHFRWSI